MSMLKLKFGMLKHPGHLQNMTSHLHFGSLPIWLEEPKNAVHYAGIEPISFRLR